MNWYVCVLCNKHCDGEHVKMRKTRLHKIVSQYATIDQSDVRIPEGSRWDFSNLSICFPALLQHSLFLLFISRGDFMPYVGYTKHTYTVSIVSSCSGHVFSPAQCVYMCVWVYVYFFPGHPTRQEPSTDDCQSSPTPPWP